MSDALVIVLPVPSRRISPNGRCHWRPKAKLTKSARRKASVLTKQAIDLWFGWMRCRSRFDFSKSTKLFVLLVPLLTKRTDVKIKEADKKLDRWRKIILESAKQCGRAKLMQIEMPIDLKDLIKNSVFNLSKSIEDMNISDCLNIENLQLMKNKIHFV